MLLASGNPSGLAVHAGTVYWADVGTPAMHYTNGSVFTIPTSGGTLVTLASGQGQPSNVAVSAAAVFWMTSGLCTTGDSGVSCASYVMSVPLGGGTPTTIASGQNFVGLALDTTSVYWAIGGSNGAIMTAPLAGGTENVVVSGVNYAGVIAVDSANVYWSSGTGSSGAVVTAPLTGGAATTLASGQEIGTLTVDSASVYLTNSAGSGMGGVNKVPLGGGALTTIASGQTYADFIAVDSAAAYWTNWENPGTVMTVPIGGGTITTLASGQSTPAFIAVDQNSVYWTDNGSCPSDGGVCSGAVMKVAKP